MPKYVDPDRRRQDIVDAVFRIVVADGLERASLREVAEESELAVGSVRHYFRSSDELLIHTFATVVDRILDRVEIAADNLQKAVDAGAGTEAIETAALHMLSELLPIGEERATDTCVWLAFRNAARIKDVFAAEAARSHRGVGAAVGQLITALRGPAAAQDLDALVVDAELLMSTVDGLSVHALLQPQWLDEQTCRAVLTRQLRFLARA
ncbi:TetR/AcrR family transcriptional regulator [Pseudarthrobacter sp. J1763]|uniref:TetR/AcrR family transcriptional regulator n=1 Tax=Pseudarthrobacter sp. J1763 TaxID=3420445 RepID=UPI003D2E9B4B